MIAHYFILNKGLANIHTCMSYCCKFLEAHSTLCNPVCPLHMYQIHRQFHISEHTAQTELIQKLGLYPYNDPKIYHHSWWFGIKMTINVKRQSNTLCLHLVEFKLKRGSSYVNKHRGYLSWKACLKVQWDKNINNHTEPFRT